MFPGRIHRHRSASAAGTVFVLALYLFGPMTEIAATIAHDLYHRLRGESARHALDHGHVHDPEQRLASAFAVALDECEIFVAPSHRHPHGIDNLLSAATADARHDDAAPTADLSQAWDHILPPGETGDSFSSTHRAGRPTLLSDFLEDTRWERPPRTQA